MKHQTSYTKKNNPVYGEEVIESVLARRSINALLATHFGSIMLQNTMLGQGMTNVGR